MAGCFDIMSFNNIMANRTFTECVSVNGTGGACRFPFTRGVAGSFQYLVFNSFVTNRTFAEYTSTIVHVAGIVSKSPGVCPVALII